MNRLARIVFRNSLIARFDTVEGEKVRFGFHNFRHALATALVKLKVDAKTVQGMLEISALCR